MAAHGQVNSAGQVDSLWCSSCRFVLVHVFTCTQEGSDAYTLQLQLKGWQPTQGAPTPDQATLLGMEMIEVDVRHAHTHTHTHDASLHLYLCLRPFEWSMQTSAYLCELEHDSLLCVFVCVCVRVCVYAV